MNHDPDLGHFPDTLQYKSKAVRLRPLGDSGNGVKKIHADKDPWKYNL